MTAMSFASSFGLHEGAAGCAAPTRGGSTGTRLPESQTWRSRRMISSTVE